MINVQFVYGAGPDNLFGSGLRELRDEVVKKFGAKVYVPRIIDYTEYETLLRLLRKWQDPTILVGHSCGCMSITQAALAISMERVPYLMAIAPSIYCPVAALPNNVRRATQMTSWWGDFFNPGGRNLLYKTGANTTTVLDFIYTGYGHVPAPFAPVVGKRLLAEVDLVLGGK